MSKIWVETRTIEPPDRVTLTGRFGASIMFVAYSKALDRWVWLQPRSIEERIAEPEMILVDANYVNKHTLKIPRAARERRTLIREKRSSQLQLAL
jgi:hypothetical protein